MDKLILTNYPAKCTLRAELEEFYNYIYWEVGKMPYSADAFPPGAKVAVYMPGEISSPLRDPTWKEASVLASVLESSADTETKTTKSITVQFGGTEEPVEILLGDAVTVINITRSLEETLPHNSGKK